MARLRFEEDDGGLASTGRPSDLVCTCASQDAWDLTVTEGAVTLVHPECGKAVDLDHLGWWDEALDMEIAVRVRPDFIEDRTIDGPEPSYINLIPYEIVQDEA